MHSLSSDPPTATAGRARLPCPVNRREPKMSRATGLCRARHPEGQAAAQGSGQRGLSQGPHQPHTTGWGDGKAQCKTETEQRQLTGQGAAPWGCCVRQSWGFLQKQHWENTSQGGRSANEDPYLPRNQARKARSRGTRPWLGRALTSTETVSGLGAGLTSESFLCVWILT